MLEQLKTIYDYTGVQFYVYFPDTELTADMKDYQVDELCQHFFDDRAAEQRSQGENLYLMLVTADRGNARISLLYGSNARYLVNAYVDENLGSRMQYSIDTYNSISMDGEADVKDINPKLINAVTYAISPIVKGCPDYEAYFQRNLSKSRDECRQYILEMVIMAALALICFGGAAAIFAHDSSRKNRERQKKLWDEQYTVYAGTAINSGFDDIDDPSNPYHDLVAKYGGFEADEVKTEQ